MGVWGYGSFENNEALALIAELKKSPDVELVREAVQKIIHEQPQCLHAADCWHAIAAAEVVAARAGQPSAEFQRDQNGLATTLEECNGQDIALARRAVAIILDDSELRELWSQSAEDYPKWQAALEDLLFRLSGETVQSAP